MSSMRFSALLFESVLDHEEKYRASVAHLAREPGYVLAANPEIPGPEANLFLRIRTGAGEVEQILRRARKHSLGIVVDSRARPSDLAQRLEEEGFESRGRRFVAFLDPSVLEVLPPGAEAKFTAVGPGELNALLRLMGAEGEKERRIAWSLRLRNLLFSAYLLQRDREAQAGLVLFHCGDLARLEGPFPELWVNDYPLLCALASHAWKRAKRKNCSRLYTLVRSEFADSLKPVGFRVHEGWWLETYVFKGSER